MRANDEAIDDLDGLTCFRRVRDFRSIWLESNGLPFGDLTIKNFLSQMMNSVPDFTERRCNRI